MHIMKGLEGDDVCLTSTFVHFQCSTTNVISEGIWNLLDTSDLHGLCSANFLRVTFIDLMEVCQETKVFFQSGKWIPFCLQ